MRETMAKRLNVIKITNKELAEKWEIPVSMTRYEHYYVRCDSKGNVSWDKTLAYSADELVERENVKILKNNEDERK